MDEAEACGSASCCSTLPSASIIPQAMRFAGIAHQIESNSQNGRQAPRGIEMLATGKPLIDGAAEVFEDRAWYALQCEPRKERLAIRQLWTLGVDTLWMHYLAAVRLRVGRSTRRGYALRGWFQPYVFVADGPAFSVGKISNLMGVSSFVRAGDELLKIPPFILWEIRSLGDPSGLIPQARIAPANMVEVRGENFIDCLRRLGGMKARVWAAGMTATIRT